MRRRIKRATRAGFTLIEVLVTTVVIGVLASVLVPAMMRQMQAASPTKLASDLNAIKMGIASFAVDVQPYFPGDLEDLINNLSTTDQYLTVSGGTAYPAGALGKWSGPYIERVMVATSETMTGDTKWPAGANGAIDADLAVCSSATGTGCQAATEGATTNFVAVKFTGISANEFANLNEVIDGVETATSTTGVLRYNASSETFYLAVPYSSP